MASRKKKGGIGGVLISAVMVFVMLAGGLAFARVNNIHDISELFDFARQTSGRIEDCTGGEVDWKCGPNKQAPPEKNAPPAGQGGKYASDIATLSAISTTERDDKAEYNRKDWKHWIGSPCNTRETVLKTQGKNVTTDANCAAKSGTWVEPYSGKTVTDAKKLDIDHVIPLGYAGTHGADTWDAAKKEQFANDTSQLVAVDASANREKSDKGPGEWMPSNKSYHCSYAHTWVQTAQKYGLGLGQDDKKVLENTLSQCKG